MSSLNPNNRLSTNEDQPSILGLHNMQKTLQAVLLKDTYMSDLAAIATIRSKLDDIKDPGLHSLPNEVLEQILALAKTETLSPPQETSISWPVNEEHPLLKTMRLVSPSFNIVASRFLFRIVVLYEHPDRYEALNNIASVPYLAPLVEGVQLVNLGYLPDCYEYGNDEESHKCRAHKKCGSLEYLKSFSNRTNGPCSTFRTHPPAGGPCAALDFSPGACYQRYVSWRDGERTMKDHINAGTAPLVNLQLLPNLRSIDTVGLREMRVIKREQPDAEDCDLYFQRPETRRYYETGLIEENALKGRTYLSLAHLQTFMIAASTCGKEITCLTIHRLDNLYGVEGCNIWSPAIQLRALRRLEIDLTKISYSYAYLSNPRKLSSWVHTLENLEELVIYQNPEEYMYRRADVVRLLENVPFPKLAKIELRDVRVGFEDLKQFLLKHNETLKHIEILNPFMKQERWDEFRARYTKGSSLAEAKKVWMSKLVGR